MFAFDLKAEEVAMIQPVSQEHPMGCGAACVASLCGLPYQKALELFKFPKHAWTRGFYCSEIVQALNAAGLQYVFEEFKMSQHSQLVKMSGTIVFIRPSTKYPSGHYLLRWGDSWMNPWSNFPMMNPVQSAFEKKLRGKISYLVYARI